MQLPAYAKVNFTLDVLNRRADGYHELRSVMQTITLCDSVQVEATRADETQIQVKTNRTYLPADERNTAYQAAARFLQAAGICASVSIQIQKRIPVGAGLGGGSADAAAVLRALNSSLNVRMTPSELEQLAMTVGADVPFLLHGGCALAEGIGERLTRLPVLPQLPMVICKPRPSASTRHIFETLDAVGVDTHPDTERAIAAIRANQPQQLAAQLHNVLEPVTTAMHPVVGKIRKSLLEAGAMGAAMTGTGTAVFALFDQKPAALAAVRRLKAHWPQTYLVQTAAEF